MSQWVWLRDFSYHRHLREFCGTLENSMELLKLEQDRKMDTSQGFKRLHEGFKGVCNCSTEFEHSQRGQRRLDSIPDTPMYLDKTKYTSIWSGCIIGWNRGEQESLNEGVCRVKWELKGAKGSDGNQRASGSKLRDVKEYICRREGRNNEK